MAAVTSAVLTPADGVYAIGRTLSFTVTFDEDVTVTGTDSSLELVIGSTPRSAAFLSATANSVIYAYTVQAGDSDANGITVGTIALGSSTIRNAANIDANLSLLGHVPSTAGVLVDGVAPMVAGTMGVPVDKTYHAGETLSFTVAFDKAMTVTGASSTLDLTIGNTARSAVFASQTANSITYTYTVQVGDSDANGISIGAISLNGSAIRDGSGNDAGLALSGHVPSTANVLVDAIAPSISGNVAAPANATYGIGETLSFTLTFDENVTVTGTDSTLGLTIGSAVRSAAFASKTSNSVTYTYAVQAGDSDADGISINGLTLGGTTLRDAAGNGANLALAGHLPTTTGVLVDAAGPAFASATVDGNRLVLTYVDTNELDAVHAPAAGAFVVNVGGSAVSVDSVTVNASAKTVTLVLASAVANGQAVTVAYADPTGGNDLNAIQDVHGNDAASLLPTAVTNLTPVPPSPPAPPSPPPLISLIDGVAVASTTVVRSDGSVANVLTIPVVALSRIDQIGGNTVADIPLVKDAGGNSLLAVQVPVGVGLEASGSSQSKPAGSSLTDLVREIGAHTASGSPDQSPLTAGAGSFIDGLPGSTPLLVQTIVASGSGNGADGVPLGIIGQPQSAGAPQTALVIDVRSQPNGMHVELQNVDFAMVIGAATLTGGAGAQQVWGDGASQNIFLGAGDDVLHGGAGNDIVGSASGNDRIYGDAGDDLVYGGEGNDLLDGGTGQDIARFAGNVEGYSLRVANGRLTMTDRVGSDGVDTVAAVETLRFSGGQSLGTDAVLARLYEGLLHRAGSAAEISWWHDAYANGVSMRQIASAITSSSEASRLSGTTTDSGFVASLYQHVLGRSVKAGEDAFWLQQLATGADRASVALAFVNSAEKLATPLDVDVNRSDVGVLVRMYHTMFGRAPDESGLNFWLQAHEQGVSLGAIADAFAGASEAKGKLGDGSDAAFIDYVYRTGMERAPLPGEKTVLLEQLQHGDRGQLLLDVAESAETIAVVGSVNTSFGSV
jgi:uncharacterized repeat protein (TIGR02059 family)